jgi:molecular chaperone GrpE
VTDDPTRQGRPDPDEEAPRVTDKRRIDPETGRLREPTPEEAVLAEAEQAATAAEETVMLEGLVEAQKLAAERLDELQRRNADYFNLEQQYSAYVKRSKAEALTARDLGVASGGAARVGGHDDNELAPHHGDLVGPFASIAEKLEGTLGRFGIERYGAAGEPFDPQVHEALMHGHSADVTEPTVQQVLQPGYRMGERVIRAARVAVVDPEA